MTTLAAGGVQLTGAGPGVHGDGLADDEAIADELADGLTGVGVGDFVDLVGIEPDLVLAAADDRGGQALLGGEVDPVGERIKISMRCMIGCLILSPSPFPNISISCSITR